LATLIFTVTNDLSYDQRMQRICGSLAAEGYDVLLIGRNKRKSIPLIKQNFRQKRLHSWFQKGPGLYIEYNFRLFFYLLFCNMDAICAIDLDTILPCYFISLFRNKKRVYDAHELFTEMKEIVSRPLILKWWMSVEGFAVPKFKNGYTVNQSLVHELNRRYGVQYEMVRNLPKYEVPNTKYEIQKEADKSDEYRSTTNDEPATILYQGAVNEGRSFETLIPAMQHVNATLMICGDGNFFEQTKQLIKQYNVEEKVQMKGYVTPAELKVITPTARIAVMLFEATGMNQYHSLANRFFDYIMAGVPQICVNYPEYKAINDKYNIALMIDDTKVETIAAALNTLLSDDTLHEQLSKNCLKAREELNWRSEEKKLIAFYQQLLNDKMYKCHAKDVMK
jgi:glycosyltransferase involved in cell wall biosynthesis